MIAVAPRAFIRRHLCVIVTTIACVLICIWAISAHRRTDTYTTDSSYYEGLADSLAARQGYSFDFKAHTRYPPGFPAVLALAGSVVGHDYTSYVRLMPLFGLVGVLAMLAIIAREESPPVAAIACLLLVSSPQFFRSATQDVLSDLPFFAVSGLALAAGSAKRSSAPAAFFAAASLAIRSAGVALIAAFAMTLLSEWRALSPRARRTLAIAAAAGAAAEMAWLVWTLTHASPDWPGEAMDSYIQQLLLKDPHQPASGPAMPVDVVQHARDGLAALAAHFAEIVTRVTWVAPRWYSPLVAGPIIVIASGIRQSLVQHQSVLLAWYTVAYCALYALWPFDEGPRFVLPIFPLLILFAIRGLAFWRKTLTAKPWVTVPTSPLLMFLAVAAYWSASHQPQPGLQDRLSVGVWSVLSVASLAFARTRSTIASWFRPLELAVAAAALIVALGSGLFAQAGIAAANRTAASPPSGRSSTVDVASWLRARPDEGSVMVQQTAVLFRLTGRQTISFPTIADGALIARTIERHAVTYLIVADDRTDQFYRPSERTRFEALAAAVPTCCDLAYANDGFRVYRLAVSPVELRPAGTLCASSACVGNTRRRPSATPEPGR